MSGQYDSYGRVFKPGLDSSIEWVTEKWNNIIDLCFNDSEADGIAAYHSRCVVEDNWENYKHVNSDNDPNQGWGKYKIDRKNDSARHIAAGKLLFDSKINLTEEKVEQFDEYLAEAITDISEIENLSYEELEVGLTKFVEADKNKLGDLYSIKEAAEEFIYQELIKLRPEMQILLENETKKDPMAKTMYMHAFSLGLFDIFK